MKILKMAVALAFAAASTAATAASVVTPANSRGDVSTCYYMYTIITPDGVYDVYECYQNSDGSY